MSKRRKFSAEFKREAGQMAAMPGVTLRQVTKDLGISEGLLGRWKRDLVRHGDKAFIGQGHARDEELMRLRRELAKVRQERDSLKGAASSTDHCNTSLSLSAGAIKSRVFRGL